MEPYYFIKLKSFHFSLFHKKNLKFTKCDVLISVHRIEILLVAKCVKTCNAHIQSKNLLLCKKLFREQIFRLNAKRRSVKRPLKD